MRKQLERQARRLQQSKAKPGVNTVTLVEGIQQTIIELRLLNRSKETSSLIGREVYSLLIDSLDVDVNAILSRIDFDSKTTRVGLTKSSGGDSSVNMKRGGGNHNSFSIENLLNGSQKHDKFLSNNNNRNESSTDLDVTQPAGFMVTADNSYTESECQDDDDSDSDCDDDRSDISSRRSCSSPELDVTDESGQRSK